MSSTAVDPLGGVKRPLRGPFTRWPHTADAILVIVILVADVLNGVLEDTGTTDEFALRLVNDIPIAAYVVVVVGSVALYWRRHQPLIVLGVNVVASLLWIGFGYVEDPLFALLVSLYTVGRYAVAGQWGYAGVGAAAALVGIWSLVDGQPVVDVGVTLLIMLLAWYIGRRLGIRGEYPTQLEKRAAYLEKERVAEAKRAVTEERSRIARELHDVVAHRVSLMTVQAGAAKTVARSDPAAAVEAMEAVEHAGREALGELRLLLGVLRPEAEINGLGPQPGIAEIPDLVDQLAGAGLDVSLSMDGVPADVPARVALSAFRITQEALTNVLKHGGPGTQAEVRLDSNDQAVTVEVVNTGSAGSHLPGAGQGIVGMRERAVLLGGSFDAGPQPDGRFRVVARLPLRTEQT